MKLVIVLKRRLRELLSRYKVGHFRRKKVRMDSKLTVRVTYTVELASLVVERLSRDTSSLLTYKIWGVWQIRQEWLENGDLVSDWGVKMPWVVVKGYIPVQRARKFSAVFGTLCANSYMGEMSTQTLVSTYQYRKAVVRRWLRGKISIRRTPIS